VESISLEPNERLYCDVQRSAACGAIETGLAFSVVQDVTLAQLQERVADGILRLGVAETSRRLGTERQTTLRLGLGARVRRGSLALAKANLHRLGEAGPK